MGFVLTRQVLGSVSVILDISENLAKSIFANERALAKMEDLALCKALASIHVCV